MAFINSEIYGSGLSAKVLNDNVKTFVALVDSSEKILAYSEIRCGAGDGSTNISSETLKESVDTSKLNKVGSYDVANKRLTINSIDYNRTASALTTGSETATKFAIFKLKDGAGYSAATVSYTKDKKDYGFYGPTKLGEYTNNDILISGDLSSSVTIGANSNFLFGGATITFSEQ